MSCPSRYPLFRYCLLGAEGQAKEGRLRSCTLQQRGKIGGQVGKAVVSDDKYHLGMEFHQRFYVLKNA